MRDIDWDRIIFPKARHESGKFEIADGHILFAVGNRQEASGVAILVHNKHVRNKMKHYVHNHRLLQLNINLSGVNFAIFGCYLPHAGYAEENVRSLYDLMSCQISRARSQRRNIVVAGDFQTELDVNLHRGLMLLQWSDENKLKASNHIEEEDGPQELLHGCIAQNAWFTSSLNL